MIDFNLCPWRNPNGRTGLRGRGKLWRWGPNHSVKVVISRWKRYKSDSFIKVNDKRVMEVIIIQKRATGELTLPEASSVWNFFLQNILSIIWENVHYICLKGLYLIINMLHFLKEISLGLFSSCCKIFKHWCFISWRNGVQFFKALLWYKDLALIWDVSSIVDIFVCLVRGRNMDICLCTQLCVRNFWTRCWARKMLKSMNRCQKIRWLRWLMIICYNVVV